VDKRKKEVDESKEIGEMLPQWPVWYCHCQQLSHSLSSLLGINHRLRGHSHLI